MTEARHGDPARLYSGWRDRAVERALRDTRTKVESRADRFIKCAIGILAETGHTDFTLQELAERAKTSLRSFYQYFGSKDELLLALFEEIVDQSAQAWSMETANMAADDALRRVIERMSSSHKSEKQDTLNRALSLYNQHLAESRPSDYVRVLGPLKGLVSAILERGVASGVFRSDFGLDTMTALILHAALGAARIHSMGAELTGSGVDANTLFRFCVQGLGQPRREPTTELSGPPQIRERHQ